MQCKRSNDANSANADQMDCIDFYRRPRNLSLARDTNIFRILEQFGNITINNQNQQLHDERIAYRFLATHQSMSNIVQKSKQNSTNCNSNNNINQISKISRKSKYTKEKLQVQTKKTTIMSRRTHTVITAILTSTESFNVMIRSKIVSCCRVITV